ncbi:hypothetical protein Tco_0758887 [Tanacetum coccineum]
MSTKQRYALIDSNKKVDLENSLCPDESRILTDILKNPPLRFSISASSSVPWIYLGTIFHLPQVTDNHHDHFIPALTFSKMVPFYINDLDFTPELRLTSNFKTTGLLQPWLSLLFKESNNTDSLSQIHKADRNSKGIVGMKILDWMITNELKFIENYRLYAEVFGVDVPTTHLAEQKSHEELEATQNVEKVKEHLIATEIEKLIKGSENVEETVEVTSSPLRNDDNQNDPRTRLEPRSDKESLEVENISDISQPVNVIEEEEELAEDDYELRRREKGKHLEEIRNTPSPIIIRSPRIPTNLISLDTEKL